MFVGRQDIICFTGSFLPLCQSSTSVRTHDSSLTSLLLQQVRSALQRSVAIVTTRFSHSHVVTVEVVILLL